MQGFSNNLLVLLDRFFAGFGWERPVRGGFAVNTHIFREIQSTGRASSDAAISEAIKQY